MKQVSRCGESLWRHVEEAGSLRYEEANSRIATEEN